MSKLSRILNPQDTNHMQARREKVKSLGGSPHLYPGAPEGIPTPRISLSRPITIHSPHPNCPDTLDCLPDTDGRPQHTLPVILRCAILGSQRKRLTIRDIYAAMEGKYPYYRTAGATWKQSVRHHLSLNRLFEREPRPNSDPGFGSYWIVNLAAPPGTKRPRKRGRPSNDEGQTKKRGRPRKILDEAGGLKKEPEHPPIATMPMPIPIPVTRSPQSSRRSHISDMKSESYGSEDDELSEEEVDMGEPIETDYESEEDQQEIHGKWTSSHTLVSSHGMSHDRTTMASVGSFGHTGPVYEGLRNEIDDLRRQNSIASSFSSRTSEQLAEAQADVTRLRLENEKLKRELQAETARRIQVEAVSRLAEKQRLAGEENFLR